MKLRVLIALSFAVSLAAFSGRVMAAEFVNPLMIESRNGCSGTNIDDSRFTSKVGATRRVAICEAMNDVAERLRNGNWTRQLDEELTEVWRILRETKVVFDEMPADMPGGVVALARSFPDDVDGDSFVASVGLKSGIEEKKWFYHVVLHELRHVYDFHEIWRVGKNLPQFEIERRAFHMMSVFDQQTPRESRFSKVPQLWHDDWLKLPANELEFRRETAIAKFLKKSLFYRDLEPEPMSSRNETQAVGPMPDESEYVRPRLVRRKN